MNYLQVFGASALAIAVLMVSTWVVSVRLKNASIVDIVWGEPRAPKLTLVGKGVCSTWRH